MERDSPNYPNYNVTIPSTRFGASSIIAEYASHLSDSNVSISTDTVDSPPSLVEHSDHPIDYPTLHVNTDVLEELQHIGLISTEWHSERTDIDLLGFDDGQDILDTTKIDATFKPLSPVQVKESSQVDLIEMDTYPKRNKVYGDNRRQPDDISIHLEEMQRLGLLDPSRSTLIDSRGAMAQPLDEWEQVLKKSRNHNRPTGVEVQKSKIIASRKQPEVDNTGLLIDFTANRFDGLTNGNDEGNEDMEINAHLNERFTSNTRVQTLDKLKDVIEKPKTPLDLSLREYFKIPSETINTLSWQATPNVPTAYEIGRIDNCSKVDYIEIPPNKVVGAWDDKNEYLQSHYELLREDAVCPLRSAVAEVRANPKIIESESEERAGIYENVYITGMTLAAQGIAVRVEFSLRRAGKKIRWEQSKRLISGSIVALTPADDMFQRTCRVAVVAARPLEGLRCDPPMVDLFFGKAEEIEIDPQQEWVMVEARSAYFESYRHTLCALQKIARESFPLAEHLVSVQKEVFPPQYVQQQPLKDLSCFSTSNTNNHINVDVIDDWPEQIESDLDKSQIAALRRILTKRLAIVQGPPGTGKTHVSAVALKVLLSNLGPGDPPIIVSAHTNHALDQLLRHIASFEPDFVRLGGRSVDLEIIKPRTLYEIRQRHPIPNPIGGLRGHAMKRKSEICQLLEQILQPLSDGDSPLPAKLFLNLSLITQAQYDSLQAGARAWVSGDGDDCAGAIATWLGKDLLPMEKRRIVQDFGLEFEEVDQEFEQLKELEAEGATSDGDEFEILKGVWIPLLEPFTGRQTISLTDQQAQKLLRQYQDLWRLPSASRGALYRYLQRKTKAELCTLFRRNAEGYEKIVQDIKIGRWEVDTIYLQRARIIGMTTTGLSKYRALIASVKPEVVLIEEAAETLEAHVAAACFDTLEHIILVGDHQQLRGHCAVSDLEGDPFNLTMSLFERMVNNEVEYSQLTMQRRMLPEIRQILTPIYGCLDDHPSVLGRESIRGMGGVNSFFHSHNMPESNNDDMSKQNKGEAELVIGLFDYLVLNGTKVEDITVLTFYNGQRKIILNGLRKHQNMQGDRFKVATVDSYQGEENEIVLLSLVRNNGSSQGGIGFLDIENRVCVALSRARRGFYIFGSDRLLRRSSTLWEKVIKIMEDSRRIGYSLPITCTNHGQKLEIREGSDWHRLNGGCARPCDEDLPCGHLCQLKCHVFDHAAVNCQRKCDRKRTCGHSCLEKCYVQPCKCECGKGSAIPHGMHQSQASVVRTVTGTRVFPKLPSQQSLPGPSRRGRQRSPNRRSPQAPLRNSIPLTAEGKAFRDFAEGGHEEADAQLEAAAVAEVALQHQRKADEAMAAALFGGDELNELSDNSGCSNSSSDLLESRNGAEGQGNLRKIRRMKWNPMKAVTVVSEAPVLSLLDL